MTPQWFDCWRFRTWNARLDRRRLVLWTAEAIAEGTEWGQWTADRVQKAEKRVNRALVKRNAWRKRACENCRSRVQRSKV